MKTDYDVIIIGGRIAGSVLASKLGDSGFSVLVVEKATFPSNTLSTHFFRGMSALKVFDEIGVRDKLEAMDIAKLTHQVDYIGGTEQYSVSDGQGIDQIGYNLNLRRYELDNVLNQRVRSTPNVTFMERTKLVDLAFYNGFVTAKLETNDRCILVSSRLIVGADGRNSTVAKLTSPEVEHEEVSHRIMVYRYFSDLDTYDGQSPKAAEYSVYHDEIAYIFPISGTMSLAAISVHRSRLQEVRELMNFSFSSLFRYHPSIKRRIESAIPVSKSVRSDLKESYMRVPYGENWVLIGDAGMHFDPWSGLGIDSASLQASILAEELVNARDNDFPLPHALEMFHSRRNEKFAKLYYVTLNHSRDFNNLYNDMKAKIIAE